LTGEFFHRFGKSIFSGEFWGNLFPIQPFNMRTFFSMMILLALLPLLMPAQVDLSNKEDSLSYALGLDIANNLGNFEYDFNYQMIYQGLRSVQGEDAGILTPEQAQALLMAFQQEMMAAQQEKMAADGEAARVEGQVFLEANQEKEGVVTTPSGLQYKELRAGTGASPGPESVVKVHYEGRLLDDSVFDSSYERGTPAEFMVSRVIPGWTEGIQLMKTGAKWQLYIPYNLAYGERGSPPNIGPFETLVFDVELLEVK
jgi:FKBP-type peptidyl-prolyl cis-trans isomerase FklB